MHYSQRTNHVRVDFFKLSGKWYCTEEVEWTGEWEGTSLILREFAKTLKNHLLVREDNYYRLRGMYAVCLEPYHENAFPLMVRTDSAVDGVYD
jgi:hypothetical protein